MQAKKNTGRSTPTKTWRARTETCLCRSIPCNIEIAGGERLNHESDRACCWEEEEEAVEVEDDEEEEDDE